MTTDSVSLLATIVLLFPMLYFLLVTPTFFLARFDDPIVTRMLRNLFNVYFLSVAGGCAIGALAFAVAARPLVALGLGAIAALAVGARRWFLGRIDAQLRARDAGDRGALRRLRRLQLAGMAYNSVQFAAILVSIPSVFVGAM